MARPGRASATWRDLQRCWTGSQQAMQPLFIDKGQDALTMLEDNTDAGARVFLQSLLAIYDEVLAAHSGAND